MYRYYKDYYLLNKKKYYLKKKGGSENLNNENRNEIIESFFEENKNFNIIFIDDKDKDLKLIKEILGNIYDYVDNNEYDKLYEYISNQIKIHNVFIKYKKKKSIFN